MKPFRIAITDGIASIVWDAPGRSLNVFTDEAIEEFGALFDRLEADAAVRGVVLSSGKSSFCAGADLAMFEALHRRFGVAVQSGDLDAFAEMLGETSRLAQLFARIGDFAKPVAVAIDGIALGGGLELALACTLRVAGPNARLGLPEVKVGLLPGAGGTQRLPRLIGSEAAMRIMLGGEPVNAEEAARLGLVDALVPAGEDIVAHATKLLRAHLETPQTRPDRRSPLHPAMFEPFVRQRPDLLTHYPGAAAILACVQAGIDLPLDQGLTLENYHFAQVVAGPVAAAMMRTQFLWPQALSRPGADEAGLSLTRIGLPQEGLDAIASELSRSGLEIARGEGAESCDLVLSATEGPAVEARAADAGEASIQLDFTGNTLGIVSDEASALPGRARLLAKKLRRTPIMLRGSPVAVRLLAALNTALDVMPGEPKRAAMIARAAGFAPPAVQADDMGAPDEALEFRLLASVALEAVRLYAAGVTTDPRGIDLAAVSGAGFPAWTGGPLGWIDQIGAADFLARLEPSADVPPLLRDMAAKGGSFYRYEAD